MTRPRLLFDATDLGALRDSARSGIKAELLAGVVRLCRALLTPDSPHYFDYQECAHEMWRSRRGIFRVVPSLELLALGYVFTAEAEFGNAARDAVLSIIDRGLADLPSQDHGSATKGWRRGHGHDKAKLALALALTFDWCYVLFTPAQREKTARFAAECGEISLAAYDIDRVHVANNRGARGLLVPALLAMAFADEPGFTAPARTLELAEEVAVLPYLFQAHDADGAPYEGPGYASTSLAFMALAGVALARHGYGHSLRCSVYARYLQYLLYELVPGGGTVNPQNDCHPGVGCVAAALPTLSGEQAALVPWLARQLSLHPQRLPRWLDTDNIELSDFDNVLILWYLLWWHDDLPVRTPTELGYPLTRHFREIGIVSMRTGWADNDWLLSHRCGRIQSTCHSQGDNNHLTLYAEGECFLADAGYGLGLPQTDRWYQQASAHNVVLVDGIEQKRWAPARLLEVRCGEEFDTTLGDATDALAGQLGPDYYWRRRVVFVRCPYRLLIVIDAVDAGRAGARISALWHSSSDHTICVQGREFRIHGGARDCAGQVLAPAAAELFAESDHGRPRLRVETVGKVVDLITVFAPLPGRDLGEPSFRWQRVDDDFEITCDWQGAAVRIRAGANVAGPLAQPSPVSVTRS